LDDNHLDAEQCFRIVTDGGAGGAMTRGGIRMGVIAVSHGKRRGSLETAALARSGFFEKQPGAPNGFTSETKGAVSSRIFGGPYVHRR
jgi:hypothetical protein